jgi:hypothetical protein
VKQSYAAAGSKTTRLRLAAELSRILCGRISNGSKSDPRGDFMTEQPSVEDFKVGDRVVHDRLGDGDVVDVSDGKVTVKFFDTFKIVGMYDAVWFGMYKLANLTAKADGRAEPDSKSIRAPLRNPSKAAAKA